MKFKVGDKVRVIKCKTMGNSCPCLGKIGTIIEANGCAPYLLDIDEDERWFDDELELVQKKTQFTKSDLKDGDIVTYRNGAKRTLKGEKLINQEGYEMYDLIQYKTDLTDIGEQRSLDIIKVERPVQYETVYERKEEILDEAEKRWLDNFIKSTGIKVKYIQKWLGASCENEYLEIEYSNYWSNNEILFLPVFKRDTKYKGMKTNKKYTLEELRTIKE